MTWYDTVMIVIVMLAVAVSPLAPQDRDVSGEPPVVTSQVDPSKVIEWYEAVRIGTVSGDPPETSFGLIRDVSLNDHGTEVYVLDRMHSQVRVFDIDGGFLRQWGRAGEGPGEFRSPQSVAVARDTVIVADHYSIHVFDTMGVLLKSFPARVPVRVSVPMEIHAHRDGWTVTIQEIVEGWPRWRTYAFQPGDSILKPWLHERVDGEASIPLLNYDPTSAVVGRDRFIEAASPAYQLQLVDGNGEVIATYRYQQKPVPLPDDPAEQYASHVRARCMERPSSACRNLEEVLERMMDTALPEHRPVVGRIIAGSDGAMMVERRDLAPNPLAPEEAEARVYDFIGANGRWLGQSRFPTAFFPYVFREGEVWGRVEDELDVGYVVRFVRMGSDSR